MLIRYRMTPKTMAKVAVIYEVEKNSIMRSAAMKNHHVVLLKTLARQEDTEMSSSGGLTMRPIITTVVR